MRFFVTGTDTDVGKTRVTAALAAALVASERVPTIVKAVQTGVPPGVPGDAAEAGALAGCAAVELARFALPADPWSAALAEGAQPVEALVLARRIDALAGPLVVEGAGGAAVPLNARETIADIARHAGCAAVVVTGMRLGCISHTILTLDYLAAAAIPVCGIVLVARWNPVEAAERQRIERGIAGRAPVLATLPYDTDARRSIAGAVPQLAAALALHPQETVPHA